MNSEELDTAWIEAHSGHPSDAFERLQSVAERLDEAIDPAFVCRFHWVSGWIQFLLGDPEAAFEHSQKARTLSIDLDLVLQANAATFNADALLSLGLSDEGFAECLIGLDLAEQSGDTWAIAYAQYVLSLLTEEGGDPEQAKVHSERALKYAHRAGDPHLISWIENNFSCVLADLADVAQRAGNETGFYDGYLASAQLSLDAANRGRGCKDSWTERIALANGAELYAQIGMFEQAHMLLERWRYVEGELSNRRLVHYLVARANVYFQEGKHAEALEMCNRGLRAAEAVAKLDLMRDCVKLLSEIHEVQGNFKDALCAYKQYHQLAQKVEGEKIRCRARAVAIYYEAEKLRKEADMARARAEKSAKEATTDPLTGVANRRHFEREFKRYLAEEPEKLAVLYIDLDHFKSVNDRFSHAIGDRVLQRAAQIFTKCCRREDLVSRIGGEEFVLLLKGVPQEVAERACTRILDSIREYDWSMIAEGLSLTTSIGMAMSHEEQNGERLLAMADARLYHAKHSGRDKFIGWDDPEFEDAEPVTKPIRVQPTSKPAPKPVSDAQMEQFVSPPSASEDGPATESA
ncbi:MAG: diguanylate cyclase [Maritimibacter sp.]